MDELVSLRELSKRLRVPAKWLKAEARAGRLPHLKAGAQLLFNFAVVRQSLARMAAGEPAEPAHAAG